MKKTIKLTESDLHNIVLRCVNEAFYIDEGLGDKIQGAVSGFHSGRQQQMSNDDDANILWSWVRSAERVAAENNPQAALDWIKQFVSIAKSSKNSQNMRGGNSNYQY